MPKTHLVALSLISHISMIYLNKKCQKKKIKRLHSHLSNQGKTRQAIRCTANIFGHIWKTFLKTVLKWRDSVHPKHTFTMYIIHHATGSIHQGRGQIAEIHMNAYSLTLWIAMVSSLSKQTEKFFIVSTSSAFARHCWLTKKDELDVKLWVGAVAEELLHIHARHTINDGAGVRYCLRH